MKSKFNLTDEQLELLNLVHAQHLSAWGTEARKKYMIEHETKIIWNDEEDCLNVYYDTGDWWHYCKDGTWY